MTGSEPLELFFAAPPGLEGALRDEAAALGFSDLATVAGGVTAAGDWSEAWRANLVLRGASRVLARVGAFRAAHLSELDKKARRLSWGAFLRPDRAVRVEATCRRSRIYHSGAAAERVARAIAQTVGAPIVSGEAASDAVVSVFARIEKDLCVVSVDLSGELLHKRGHKQAVGKAPMRETLAALFLRACAWRPDEPLIDPMCGSGTFLIEAAEIAAGLAPGRDRAFAFENLASFDAAAWSAMRAAPPTPAGRAPILGFDRDAGAAASANANAERAGVSDRIRIAEQAISDLTPPAGPPGLVIVNPPYGGRIGDVGKLKPLYAAFGRTICERFSNWRVGLVTSEPGLARATGLALQKQSAPVPHGSLRIQLYCSQSAAAS